MATNNVIVKTPESVVWPFDTPPHIELKLADAVRWEAIDPFPAYPHDRFMVNDTLKHVTKQFPIDMDVTVYVLERELMSRVNGYAQAYAYNNDSGRHGVIVLSGKRTPIHPAMTRYLVAHEYGHLVARALEASQGLEEYAYDNFYADLRDMSRQPAGYGGGTWHVAPGEILANDFRLLVCRNEVEFWPHPDNDRPETIPAVVRFWDLTQREFKAAAKARETEAAAATTVLALAS